MLLAVSFLGECFGAKTTAIRFFSGVYSSMSLQAMVAIEPFAAEFAVKPREN